MPDVTLAPPKQGETDTDEGAATGTSTDEPESGSSADEIEAPASGPGSLPATPDSSVPAPPDEEPSPIPVDPCTSDNGGCDTDPMAACTNDAGAAKCACPEGYSGSGMGSDGCIDIDQCATDNGGCDKEPKATCKDGPGTSVTCTCPSGTVGNGLGDAGCGDSNECLTNNGGCDTTPMATCVNRVGEQASCTCPSGYTGSGRGSTGCTDIDECATNNGGCGTSPMATCTNTMGSNTCACPTGYVNSGFGGCVDNNECASNNGGCDTSPMATCTNTTGSRTCSCPAGTGMPQDDDTICARFVYSTTYVWDYRNALSWQRVVPSTYSGCDVSYHGEGTAGDACNLEEAREYCESLTLNSREWRLPTSAELLSIVDHTADGPAMIYEQSFPDTPAAHFWSSTTYDASNAYYVCFCDGVSEYEANTVGHYVRCVSDW